MASVRASQPRPHWLTLGELPAEERGRVRVRLERPVLRLPWSQPLCTAGESLCRPPVLLLTDTLSLATLAFGSVGPTFPGAAGALQTKIPTLQRRNVVRGGTGKVAQLGKGWLPSVRSSLVLRSCSCSSPSLSQASAGLTSVCLHAQLISSFN